MELHQIRYFLLLCEELNFTRAAEKCNVTQPSLSRAIRLLETELGGPLFQRHRTKTQLTELGRMMRPHFDEVVVHAETAMRQARKLREASRTQLRLGVMCTISPGPLLLLVDAMTRRQSQVDLVILDSTARELEERLNGGELDIALYCRPNNKDDRLHYLKLFREQMMVVLHPDHPFSNRPALRLVDLQAERYLNRINCEFNESLAWDQWGASWNAVYRSERDDWILGMVAAGMGFGFLPAFCITHPGVVARPLVEPDIWREVHVVTARGRQHSPAVGALVREALKTDWSGRAALFNDPKAVAPKPSTV